MKIKKHLSCILLKSHASILTQIHLSLGRSRSNYTGASMHLLTLNKTKIIENTTQITFNMISNKYKHGLFQLECVFMRWNIGSWEYETSRTQGINTSIFHKILFIKWFIDIYYMLIHHLMSNLVSEAKPVEKLNIIPPQIIFSHKSIYVLDVEMFSWSNTALINWSLEE